MTEEQLKIGLPKILINSKALLADADLLYENQRNERAYSLYQLSIEEISKAFFIIGILLFDDLSLDKVQKELKKGISDHKLKTKKSIGLQSMLTNIIKGINTEIYEKLVLESFDEYNRVNEFNDKKNYGFYSSFVNDEFKTPEELITKEDVEAIKSKAHLRVYFGNTIMTPIILRCDFIKQRIKELNFDKLKSSSEQINELKRIREKYDRK